MTITTSAPAADDQPITVLIVDDHAVVRRGIRAFLGAQPDIVVVAEAKDGAQAIAELTLLGTSPTSS